MAERYRRGPARPGGSPHGWRVLGLGPGTAARRVGPEGKVLEGHAPPPRAIVWRNLLNIRRNPELLVFATVQPVIFVVMFRRVFGGAIQGSLPADQTYINSLMPGVFVQTHGAVGVIVGWTIETEFAHFVAAFLVILGRPTSRCRS